MPKDRFKTSNQRSKELKHVASEPVYIPPTKDRWVRVDFKDIKEKLEYISREWMFKPQAFTETDKFQCLGCGAKFLVSDSIIERDTSCSTPEHGYVGCVNCTSLLHMLRIA